VDSDIRLYFEQYPPSASSTAFSLPLLSPIAITFYGYEILKRLFWMTLFFHIQGRLVHD